MIHLALRDPGSNSARRWITSNETVLPIVKEMFTGSSPWGKPCDGLRMSPLQRITKSHGADLETISHKALTNWCAQPEPPEQNSGTYSEKFECEETHFRTYFQNISWGNHKQTHCNIEIQIQYGSNYKRKIHMCLIMLDYLLLLNLKKYRATITLDSWWFHIHI